MNSVFDDGYWWTWRREIIERVEEALSELRKTNWKVAEVARLWLFEDATEKEIATILGLSRDQVAKTKRQARNFLQKFLGGWQDINEDFLAA